MCMHALGINSQFCLGDRFWQAYVCQKWFLKGDHFWQGGPILAAKTGPGGTDLGSQNWSGGTTFGNFFAKIGLGGPILV